MAEKYRFFEIKENAQGNVQHCVLPNTNKSHTVIRAPLKQCFVQGSSSRYQFHGEKSGVKAGVLIMVVLCCACTAGLTTAGPSTPSFLCYPKFSALYPEMVDALVFLDCYGFLPADPKELPDVMRRGMDEIIQFDKRPEEKTRVYTYENAVKRLLAGNPSISEESVHNILERGLVQVDGGVVFSRDFRINLKNIARQSMEQIVDMQSRIKSPILLVLAEDGFNKQYDKSDTYRSALLQVYRERKDLIVTVPGDHHVHLNNPEVVAPAVSDFLKTKVLSQPPSQTASPNAKL
ncbi:hypothetical protein fugu_008318 [Takifugu bimaculatus]|uniref:Uncharacterized protein n=1 Tax=Takifugu bimaculatus TaxID=433685 RepID=A0A4Z2B1I0_9TELE|nr:hypothetical protein fugu_008318 [Takifugu bimaculatus]